MRIYDKLEWTEFLASNEKFALQFDSIYGQLLTPHPEQIKSVDTAVVRKHFAVCNRYPNDFFPTCICVEVAYVLDPEDTGRVLPGELVSVTIFENRSQYMLYKSMEETRVNVHPTPQQN